MASYAAGGGASGAVGRPILQAPPYTAGPAVVGLAGAPAVSLASFKPPQARPDEDAADLEGNVEFSPALQEPMAAPCRLFSHQQGGCRLSAATGRSMVDDTHKEQQLREGTPYKGDPNHKIWKAPSCSSSDASSIETSSSKALSGGGPTHAGKGVRVEPPRILPSEAARRLPSPATTKEASHRADEEQMMQVLNGIWDSPSESWG